MNMPIDEKRQVHFTTTLFALIRESLDVKKRTGIDLVLLESHWISWLLLYSI